MMWNKSNQPNVIIEDGSNSVSSSLVVSQNKRNKLPWILFIGETCVVAVFIILSFVFGWLKFGGDDAVSDDSTTTKTVANNDGNGETTVTVSNVTTYKVCGSDIINEYNGIFNNPDAEDYMTNLGNIMTKINNLGDSDKDASCQFMINYAALRLNNLELAKSSYNNLITLNEQGVYPSNEIKGLSTNETIKMYVDDLESMLNGDTEIIDGVG